jgi:hypothetical protein
LDIPAVFGSFNALDLLEAAGETGYQNYLEQMGLLQQNVLAQPEKEWLDTFYSAWLYAFMPQLAPKDTVFPAHMRTSTWASKDINSVLGSWAELKHDTVLYAKMPEFAGGGGPPTSGPAPAYVEPNPNVFYRLAYATDKIGTYLQSILFLPVDEPLPDDYLPNGLQSYADGLISLAEQFHNLGGIAEKELAGQPLAEEDYDAIQACLGPIECMVFHAHTPYGEGDMELPPMPVIAAVAGAENEILEAAVGNVDRIFVIVPLEGKLQIAQGGVFSYYEFVEARSNRLTDEAWRERLHSNPPAQPGWLQNFALEGGEPVDVLAFNIGDIYVITPEGDRLNVRETPTTTARVITQFHTDDYIEIIDGPTNAAGYTWWKVQSAFDGSDQGWVVEVQEWYKRSTLLED